MRLYQIKTICNKCKKNIAFCSNNCNYFGCCNINKNVTKLAEVKENGQQRKDSLL